MEWNFQAASYPGRQPVRRASFCTPTDHRIVGGRRCTSPLYNHRASACQTVSMPRDESCAGIAAVAVLFLVYTIVVRRVREPPGQPTSAAPTAPSTSLIVSDGVTSADACFDLDDDDRTAAEGEDHCHRPRIPPSCTSPATAMRARSGHTSTS